MTITCFEAQALRESVRYHCDGPKFPIVNDFTPEHLYNPFVLFVCLLGYILAILLYFLQTAKWYISTPSLDSQVLNAQNYSIAYPNMAANAVIESKFEGTTGFNPSGLSTIKWFMDSCIYAASQDAWVYRMLTRSKMMLGVSGFARAIPRIVYLNLLRNLKPFSSL